MTKPTFRLAPDGCRHPRTAAAVACIMAASVTTSLMLGDLERAIVYGASLVWFYLMVGAQAELERLKTSRRLQVVLDTPAQSRVVIVQRADRPAESAPLFGLHSTGETH